MLCSWLVDGVVDAMLSPSYVPVFVGLCCTPQAKNKNVMKNHRMIIAGLNAWSWPNFIGESELEFPGGRCQCFPGYFLRAFSAGEICEIFLFVACSTHRELFVD